ncbi:DNA helicase, partial [Bacillus velezensis]|nr:DNA helicase [Bacillus velezensis]
GAHPGALGGGFSGHAGGFSAPSGFR